MNKHKFLDGNMWIHKFLDGCANFAIRVIKPVTPEDGLVIGVLVILAICLTFLSIAFYLFALLLGISVWWIWGGAVIAYTLACVIRIRSFDK